LAGKYDGNGNLLWEAAWLGDLPVAVLEPVGRFYIAPDHLGAPHQITDPSGAVVWQWNPDPFGNGAPIGSLTYELRFPGQFFDQATYLHYNYFRDYDPRLGRYIESDPIGLSDRRSITRPRHSRRDSGIVQSFIYEKTVNTT
jgi:RHS repeat-associated protein